MSQFKLLVKRRFAPLFFTQFLGALNDNFFKNALVILITYQGVQVFGVAPEKMVMAAAGILILPFLVFSATAGQLADRLEKSHLVRWLKALEILCMALAALGFWTRHYELLFVVLFLLGVQAAFFSPIKYSILPQHLYEDELIGGNAWIEAGTFLAILLGTLAGGAAILVEGYGPLLVSLSGLGMAGVGLVMSFWIPHAPSADSELQVQWNPVTPSLEILRFVKSKKTLYLSMLGISWFWFYGTSVLSILPYYCKDLLRAEPAVVTALLGVSSIGIAAGSLLCELISRKGLELGLVPFGSFGMTVFTLSLWAVGVPDFIVGLPPGAPAVTLSELLRDFQGQQIIGSLFLICIFCGFFSVPLYTLVQERSDPAHRSRVIAGINIASSLFTVLSSGALILFLALELSYLEVFWVLAVLNFGAAIYVYLVIPEFFMRLMAWIVAFTMYRIRVQGYRHIPKSGPALIVSNHVTYIDWLIIAGVIQRPVRFVMYFNYAKSAFIQMIVRQGKAIRIASAKEDPQLLQQAYEQIAAELRAGNLVCLFPEGSLTEDGEMRPFKSGLERMVQDTPVPVIPIALVGFWGSFFSREGGRAIFKFPKRFWSRIEVRIGQAIPAEQAKAPLLRERILELLKGSA